MELNHYFTFNLPSTKRCINSIKTCFVNGYLIVSTHNKNSVKFTAYDKLSKDKILWKQIVNLVLVSLEKKEFDRIKRLKDKRECLINIIWKNKFDDKVKKILENEVKNYDSQIKESYQIIKYLNDNRIPYFKRVRIKKYKGKIWAFKIFNKQGNCIYYRDDTTEYRCKYDERGNMIDYKDFVLGDDGNE